MARIFLSLPSKKVRTLYTCIPQTSKKGRRGIEIKQQNIFIRAGTSEKERYRKGLVLKPSILSFLAIYVCLYHRASTQTFTVSRCSLPQPSNPL